MSEQKRLFFAFEVHAPWPDTFPEGRLLTEGHRHLTVAFLGNVSYPHIQSLLPTVPLPLFKVGLVGQMDKCLLLPPRNPHVVAWHVNWIDDVNPLQQHHDTLRHWLKQQNFVVDERPFLPHITLCRSPFIEKKWLEAFQPLPCYIQHLHLYESVGNLHYQPLWTHSLLPPFEEIEHTADIAFHIRGHTLSHLHNHAWAALAFRFPLLVQYQPLQQEMRSLPDIVHSLNHLIAKMDEEIGSPFKAISLHGNIQSVEDRLEWEMIVDV